MTQTPRPGFDGSFIGDERRGLAWLIIDGCRYQLEVEASAAMFSDGHRAVEAPELVEEIPVKGAIRAGSRLVRSNPEGAIFLFAVDMPENRLHPIISWESFVQFGFSMDKVLLVPEALLQPVPPGVELFSALDRITRRGHSMYLPLLEVLA